MSGSPDPKQLTAAQLAKVLRASGAKITNDELAALIADGCPMNNAGRIHLVEFVAWLLRGAANEVGQP